MAIQLRKTGITVVGDVPWGTHFCHFYETTEDLLDTLVPYFKAGLESNEFCLWVVSEPLTQEDVRTALRRAVPRFDQYADEGRLEILLAQEWYLHGGSFDLQRVTSGWNIKLGQALVRGYDGIRVSGNTAWLERNDWDDFCDYERQLNESITGQPIAFLCAYPMAASGAAEIFDVARNHQFAIAKRRGRWEVVETPELKQAQAEIARLNEDLEQRVFERTIELRVANEELRNEIIERKMAEASLHAREQEFRAIVENAPDHIIRYDREFRRKYVNPAAAKDYGMPVEALIGRPIGSIIQAAVQDLKDEDLAEVRKRIADVFDTGKSCEYELSWPMPTGRRDYSVRLFPELDLDGSVVNVLGISRDITESKQAEERLKQSENRLAEAQRLAQVGSWDWDLRNDIVTWSDELYRIFDIEPGECEVPHLATSFVHPEDRDLLRRAVESSIKNSEPYSLYYRILRRNGEERIVHSYGRAVSDENGEPLRVFGATQDVTDLKRSEEKLKATTEQLRALSASLQSAREEEAAHIAREIHDELGAALSSLRWDLEDVDETISTLQNGSPLSNLRQKVEAMISLTDTTVNTVRRIASELRPFALDDLGLTEAIEWQAQQFQKRTGIMVQSEWALENVDLSREQATVAFRIFQEALTNTLRHAQATRVNIQMKTEDDEFILTVGDNGRGITANEKSGQRTLGLLGMRERAHLIGAKIDISGFDRKGTVVTLRIPISG